MRNTIFRANRDWKDTSLYCVFFDMNYYLIKVTDPSSKIHSFLNKILSNKSISEIEDEFELEIKNIVNGKSKFPDVKIERNQKKTKPFCEDILKSGVVHQTFNQLDLFIINFENLVELGYPIFLAQSNQFDSFEAHNQYELIKIEEEITWQDIVYKNLNLEYKTDWESVQIKRFQKWLEERKIILSYPSKSNNIKMETTDIKLNLKAAKTSVYYLFRQLNKLGIIKNSSEEMALFIKANFTGFEKTSEKTICDRLNHNDAPSRIDNVYQIVTTEFKKRRIKLYHPKEANIIEIPLDDKDG